MPERPTPDTTMHPLVLPRCGCDGCWCCSGHEEGCTCDVDWEAVYAR